MKTPAMRILVIGPSWVGDMMMAQVLFKCLKKLDPDCVIDVLAPKWSAPLCERMPEVRTHYNLDLGHGRLGLAARYRLGKSLANQYTHCFVLPNSFKSALIPFFANIPNRIGWRGEWRNVLLTQTRILDKKRYPRMIERFAALAFPKDTVLPPLPQPCLEVDRNAVGRLAIQKKLSVDKPILALCPGAEFGSSKRWPIEHFSTVAKAYLDKGWSVWLLGSPNDAPVAQAIAATSSAITNLVGQTNLAEAIDLLSLVQAVVTNDSGLMHIACALQKPVVALYGSTDPSFTPPLGNKMVLHRLNLPCSPCFKRECPLGHHQCMQLLEPQPVIDAIERFVA